MLWLQVCFFWLHRPLNNSGTLHGCTVLGSMYVLKKKRDVINGEVLKYKARLVALGNRQPPNTYDDIKSGTAKASSFKLLLAIQASTQAKAITIDVKGAYLKAAIKEPLGNGLYLRIPDGRIFLLRKYLYGLKQSGLMWQLELTRTLTENGYAASHDPLLFYKWDGIEDFILFTCHVDDLYCISTSQALFNNLFHTLACNFGGIDQLSICKDDNLTYLGMHVYTDKQGNIHLSQQQYTEKVLQQSEEAFGLSKSPRILRLW